MWVPRNLKLLILSTQFHYLWGKGVGVALPEVYDEFFWGYFWSDLSGVIRKFND